MSEFEKWWHDQDGCLGEIKGIARAAYNRGRKDEREAMGEEREPVKYGCHCDLDEGYKPDACVFDGGRVADCLYAVKLQRDGKGRNSCEYWKPIQIHPAPKEAPTIKHTFRQELLTDEGMLKVDVAELLQTDAAQNQIAAVRKLHEAPKGNEMNVTNEMVDRFLNWKLPKDFCPDGGISVTPRDMYRGGRYEPTGTNLLSADQARAMLEYVMQGEAPTA